MAEAGASDIPRPHGGADEAVKKRLKVSIVLTGIIFLAEIIGGVWTNSLALVTDALHVLMDVLALGLSLFAISIAELPPTEKRTFGLHRAEVFAAFINSIVLCFVTVFVLYEAWGRLADPQPVESTGMLVVATIGLVVNVVVGFWLMRFASKDLNIKSAFLHVIGDAAASVGVIIGAIIIARTGWYPVDPLLSVLISLIIVYGAVRILRESGHILLEGVPRDVDLNEVAGDITSTDGVKSVHSLHIWSICHNVYALSAHVDITPTERYRTADIFDEINRKLAEYQIFYTTLQAECSGCEGAELLRQMAHAENDDHGHLH